MHTTENQDKNYKERTIFTYMMKKKRIFFSRIDEENQNLITSRVMKNEKKIRIETIIKLHYYWCNKQDEINN